MSVLVYASLADAATVISPMAVATQLPDAGGPVLSQSPAPSAGVAFLLSAVAPGTGQLYVGSGRGYLYLLAEAGLVVGYLLTHRDAADVRDDYVEAVKAGVRFDGPGGFDTWNMEDFEHATLFENWHNVYTDDGGEPLDRVGKFFWNEDFKDYDPEAGDQIPATSVRLQALGLRVASNDKFKTARRFLGVMLFNHLVSAIDARISARSGPHGDGSPVTVRLGPEDPDDMAVTGSLALSVGWRGRF